MSDEIAQSSPDSQQVNSQFAEPISIILEANGLGDRMKLSPNNIIECAKDTGNNRLLMAEVGTRRFFVTLSPALKGRLVGEDRIEDEEVRQHFEVNLIGMSLKK